MEIENVVQVSFKEGGIQYPVKGTAGSLNAAKDGCDMVFDETAQVLVVTKGSFKTMVPVAHIKQMDVSLPTRLNESKTK